MTGLKKSPEKRQHNEIEILHTIFNSLSKQQKFKYPTSDKWFMGYYELDFIFKVNQNESYQKLPSQINQNAIKDCVNNWVSYFKALKEYKKNPNKFKNKPNIIKYKKKNQMTATFTNITCKIKTNEKGKSYLRFPKTNHKLWLGNIDINKIKLKEVTVSPYYGHYKVVMVYETDETEPTVNVNPEKQIAIDLGVNNLATITNNIGLTPIIIKGKYIKSQNQYFNKKQAYYYGLLRRGMSPNKGSFTSKRLQKLALHRERYLKDQFHKISKKIITYCKQHEIGTLIVGKNDFWKQEVKLNKKNKQNFIQIPFNLLLNTLQYLCKREGILYKEQEESYTSKASFLDNDEIPTYEEINQKPVFSGKRISRELYKSQTGVILNADVNGSLNILRKSNPNAFHKTTDYNYIEQAQIWNYNQINK